MGDGVVGAVGSVYGPASFFSPSQEMVVGWWAVASRLLPVGVVISWIRWMTDVPSCEATTGGFLNLLCHGEDVQFVQIACVHEHLDDGYLCGPHRRSKWTCDQCTEADGHECVISVFVMSDTRNS